MIRVFLALALLFSFAISEMRQLKFDEIVALVSQAKGENIIIDKDALDVTFAYYFATDITPSLLWDTFLVLLKNNDLEALRVKTKNGNFYLIKKLPPPTPTPLPLPNESESIVEKMNTKVFESHLSLDELNNINPLVEIRQVKNRYIAIGEKSDIEDFFGKLGDFPTPKQLILEGEIIEINRDSLDNLGFDFAVLSSFVDSGKNVATAVGINFNNNQLIMDSKLFENGKINIINFVNFVKDRGIGKTISTPKISLIEGKKSNFSFGDRIPVINSTTTSLNTQTPLTRNSYDSIETGLFIDTEFKVLNNQIYLDVNFKFSSLVSIQDGQATTTNRNFTSSYILKNNESFFVVGLEKETTKDKSIAVPFLSNLPLLGGIFKHDYKSQTNTSLLIYFKPILRD